MFSCPECSYGEVYFMFICTFVAHCTYKSFYAACIVCIFSFPDVSSVIFLFLCVYVSVCVCVHVCDAESPRATVGCVHLIGGEIEPQ